jgi:hypothetical protein
VEHAELADHVDSQRQPNNASQTRSGTTE